MGCVAVSDNLLEVSVYLYAKAGCAGVRGSANKPPLIWQLKGGLGRREGRGIRCCEVFRNTVSLLFSSF